MSVEVRRPARGLEKPISIEWAAVVAYAMVLFVFVGDWITPVAVVVGVAYQAPVVFAALKGTRRLTFLTVVYGSLGIAIGWYVDFWQAGSRFVGWLAMKTQGNAERVKATDADRASRREGAIAHAMQRVTAASSPVGTVRAITGEAPSMLGSAVAVWCSTEPDGASWVATRATPDVRALRVTPSTTFDRLLLRIASGGDVAVVGGGESLDHLLGEPLGYERALAIPVGDGSTIVGVVFAAIDATQVEERAVAAAGTVAKLASAAVEQAHLVEDARDRDGRAG
jgi:hypothetical protein